MDPSPRWRPAALALVALGALVLVAALAGGDDAGDGGDDDGVAVSTIPAPEAPDAFLDTWRASREATYRSVSTFTRTSNSTGSTLRDVIAVAQRPPDRLTADREGVTGLVDGRRVYCTYRDEALTCRDASAQRTYDEDVDDQLATLAAYVTGAGAPYEVRGSTRAGTTCFVLTLTDADLVAPPLGTRARYCFDTATAVPTSTRIERVEADDELVAIERTTEVTDTDLDPEALAGR